MVAQASLDSVVRSLSLGSAGMMACTPHMAEFEALLRKLVLEHMRFLCFVFIYVNHLVYIYSGEMDPVLTCIHLMFIHVHSFYLLKS